MNNEQSGLLCREYIARINIVQDYIDQNISQVFTLEELSAVSGFSKYHFHRIFSGLMNETLYSYITRQKLEKAAGSLVIAPHKTITEIALDLGFHDPGAFARSFKKRYGVSASKYRSEFSKNRKPQSKQSQAPNTPASYNEDENSNNRRQNTMNTNCTVEVTDIDKMTVAYLRHTGTYAELDKVFQNMIAKLMTWAMGQGIARQGETKLLAIYHDNPDITEDDKRRTSICVTIPDETPVSGDFGRMTLPAGKYAIAHFKIADSEAAEQHTNAWKYLYGDWLPGSGFQPDDGPVFEVYVNNPKEHPERKHLLDLYLPVKPL